MRFNISAWSIRNPIPSIVLFLILTVLGVVSFRDLPVTRFPNIDLPIVQVTITEAGAAPSELETQVTKKVEDAIAGVVNIRHITSTVVEGSSTTVVQFELGSPVDRALNDVKDAVAKVRADLPSTIDEPITQRLDIEGLPILTYAVSAPAMTLEESSWFVDDTLVRALQSVKGVSQVVRVGGVNREIRVALDPDRLASLGVTAGDVNRQVRSTNIDLAGGRGEIGQREQAIRTLANQRSVADLAATRIALPNGLSVRLDDVATVSDTVEEPRTYATLDGKRVVGFAITRAKGASDVVVARNVEAKIDELRASNPGVRISLIDTSVEYTRGSYESTMHSLYEGAALAIIVVFLFLRNVRATLISAIALPLSIIPTFWAIDAMGFSLNLVSLLAITIVTGILVDDAIVEIENIVRHVHMGKRPYVAALEAADEIGLAVIAISFTIVAVFMPVSFMGGIAGQYFKQFGLTVAAAVIFSLLVARLITPLLAAYFMRELPEHEGRGPLIRLYERLLGVTLRHRLVSVAIGIAFFIASIMSTGLLPQGFLPADDQSRILIALELPPGSLMANTEAVTARVTDILRHRPDVTRVFVSGGQILGSGAEVRKATLIATLVPKTDRAKTQNEIRAEMATELANLPDVRFWFLKDNGQRDLQLVVTGRNSEGIERSAAAITSGMRSIPLLAQAVSTAELARPELRVHPEPELAAKLGVTTAAIAEAVRIATIGDVGAGLAKLNLGERQIPIRVELKDGARGDPGIIQSLKVATQSGLGPPVPLATLARFELGQGPTSINRYDRFRQVTLGADLVGTPALGEAVEAVKALPAAKNLPEGVELKQFGDAEVMGEVFSSFSQAMGAGLMMVYAVLVLLFASFLHPITILFSLPLSIGGAIIALLVTGRAISLPVVIGILMLMGIVTKNAIMLVDFAIEEMRAGVDRREAIIDAGRKRARPIVMTTIAMVGGMLPSALALGSGGEFRSPMAIAVIGGLLSSTVLSLVFVPAVLALMEDVSRWIIALFGRFVGPGEHDRPRPRVPAAE